jgi:pimeloyl-ACP methyl ester carboxylesterase
MRDRLEELTTTPHGITICHESFGDPADPPLLLVMGLGTQMIAWHDDLCAELAARGFWVTRFDNRDVGRSTHHDFPPPTLRQVVSRRLPPEQYALEDMADDTAALMDALGIDSAHVVGASMGGMISQVLAARRPERVRTLVSIMSNTGSRMSGQPALGVYRHFLKQAPAEREAFAEHAARLFSMIGSTRLGANIDDIRDVAARSFDRGHDPAGTGRQLGAIAKTGNRTPMLRRITAPTVVIHGTADRLVRPSGGRATARAIPGAKLDLIEGMGHDLPRAAWPRIIGAIDSLRDRGRPAAPGRHRTRRGTDRR